jgi:hypothetical protein
MEPEHKMSRRRQEPAAGPEAAAGLPGKESVADAGPESKSNAAANEVARLLGLLGERDPELRRKSIRALGRMGEDGKEAVPALVARVKEKHRSSPSLV